MLDMALRKAAKSQNPKARHAALVIKGGAVVSIAKNSYEHAEIKALEQIAPKRRKGSKVWSVRVLANGEPAIAKPCEKCLQYMKENGVRSVFYTTDEGTVEKMFI